MINGGLLSYVMVHPIAFIVAHQSLSGTKKHYYMREYNDGYYTIRDFKNRPIKSLYYTVSDMANSETFK